MGFFKKAKKFLKKEDKKVFSFIFILVKIFLSLFITILLPVLFLIIFIFKEPREINSLNQYIADKIANIKIIDDFKFEKATINLNKNFDLIYSVEDLDFKIKNISLNFPKTSFKIRLWDLILGKFFFNNIIINNITTYLGYENFEKNFLSDKKASKVSLNYNEIENILNYFANYFNENNRLFFNKLTIKNSTLYFFNKDTKNLDKIEIIENNVKISKLLDGTSLDFYLKTKINNKKHNLESYNSCKIKINKDIDCEIKFNNLSIHNLTNIFEKLPNLENYIKNVKGNFDVVFNIYLKDYKKIENSKFTITSEKGNFNLRQFFGDNINYKNLILNGYIEDNKSLDVRSLTAELFTDKNINKIINFEMSSEFENKDFLKLNFDITNAGVDELSILWPVFLDDLGIRDWVVEHFKSGLIPKATANLLLNYDKNKKNFSLKKVNSNVYFSNTYLDYSELFPAVHNMEAKAVFTDKDMNIYVNKAKIENTEIFDGKIYTDFTSNNASLLIDLKSKGPVYELFYFIDNKNKDKIKNIVKDYLNGRAESIVKIDIPFNNIDFKNVFIAVDGNIKNNNTFLFSDNSNLELKLLKNVKSNKFSTQINLKNSLINFPIVDFIKKKDENLDLNLDIVVLSDKILLNNIKTSENVISFDGNGTITNGELKNLSINNVKYKNNSFDFEYIDDGNMNININGEKINIYKDISKTTLKKDNVKLDKKLYFDVNFNSVIFNKKYNFEDLNIIGKYSDKINNLELTAKLADNNFSFNALLLDENKYQLSFNHSNLGSLLSYFDITDKLLNGDLYLSGTLDENNNFKGNLVVKNGFNVITKDLKNAKFYNYILNSNIVTEKFKNNLKSSSNMNFDKITTEIYLEDNVLKLKKLLAESSDIFGFGISCGGKYYLDSGKVDFEGLIAPLGKLNTLFGVNKIPVINKILFGKDKAGLFTIGYSFKKENANSDYEFDLIPISTMNSNSLRNLFLLLLLI